MTCWTRGRLQADPSTSWPSLTTAADTAPPCRERPWPMSRGSHGSAARVWPLLVAITSTTNAVSLALFCGHHFLQHDLRAYYKQKLKHPTSPLIS
eukprot:scaffold320082_cov39-Prasinocladus_malaysianus.AAC.1